MHDLSEAAIASNLAHLQSLSDDLLATWQEYQAEPHNSNRKEDIFRWLTISAYAIAAEIFEINNAGYAVILKSRESGPEYCIAQASGISGGDRLSYSGKVGGFCDQTVHLHYVFVEAIRRNDLPTSD